jgi:butyryl-CoA dehydrogenase
MQGTIARARAADASLHAHADELGQAFERAQATTWRLLAAPSSELALANSSVYLEALGHVVVAWLWLEQALATRGRSDDFHAGKRQACRFFYRHELPRTTAQFELLASLDDTTLAMRDEWF